MSKPKFLNIKDLQAAHANMQPMLEDLAKTLGMTPISITELKTAEKKACYTLPIPNLGSFPPTQSKLEIGVAEFQGVGRFQIKFDTTYSEPPHTLFCPFGFLEIQLPIPAIVTKTYSVLGYSFSLPTITLNKTSIFLPVLIFMMSIQKECMEMFALTIPFCETKGTIRVIYLAIGE